MKLNKKQLLFIAIFLVLAAGISMIGYVLYKQHQFTVIYGTTTSVDDASRMIDEANNQ